MDCKKRISDLLERWFISENAMFQIMCSHELVENRSISCPVRCGRRRVEYNPAFLDNMTDDALDEALRTEAVRILMRHPYQRRPDMCSDQAIAVGSNLTISDNYKMKSLSIESPEDYDLDAGMPYEWYSWRIQDLLQDLPGGGGDDSGSMDRTKGLLDGNSKARSDLSELWEEDEMALEMISGIIDSVKDWGSLAGSMAEKLKASTRARVDWRKVFSGFRASVLSSDRRLTRMRPSRRHGFDQMGSTREYMTRLLVAVDVSGSVTSRQLSNFFGVVNSMFRIGFKEIDVVQFDHGIRDVTTLKRAMADVTVVGRGGTSFQEPVDYAHANGYDGLMILTDGYAPHPQIPEGCRTKLLWVCEDEKSYDAHHKWMELSGRVCTMKLR